ncbi:MAG: type I polyketide synthase [Actinobacteria bacterium]|nr:type I polyketide synthase [Actinomycetota bacterium]
MTPIAVVGIDCRFPRAPDKDAFWRLMMDGVVTDTEVPPQRWDVDTYYHPDGVAGTMNTRRAHFIDDADAFDNEFFGIAPVEAAALDPQHRLLLQSSWRALEDAAIDPRSLAGTPTGVYVGVMSSEWSTLQIIDFARLSAVRGTGSGYFMAANRISYHLGLTGPSMAIDSACSSSLLAIQQGCAALRAGDTDTVIAAGANLLLIPALSIFYTQARLSAPDGRCKPFGRDADGIGRGDGVAAVVLRRLDDALTDGQPIYAVVKSSVANHDGRSNGITAPNRRAQVALMRRALELAGVDAGQLSFVEAHGTGTVLGDMIEANALGDIHRTRGGAPCLLGSVKGNIGHTEGSAGIAAFVKACLALHHHTLPPTVYGEAANPRLRLDDNGLRLAHGPEQLPAAGSLGAVSSFGLGGSNAHVVLEAAPVTTPPPPGRYGVLTLSAPSPQGLRRNAGAAADALEAVDATQVAGWCRTTNAVKRAFRDRVVLAGDRDTILDGLRRFAAGAHTGPASSAPPRGAPARIGLLCSGQGTPFPGMTRPLYDTNPVYRAHLDAVVGALDPHLQSPLLAVILGERPGLDDTALAQPALFAVSYALGKTLLQSGIRIAFGIGHSLGEVSIACLAGILPVGDAARLVAARGRLMASLPPGGAMFAADLGTERAEAALAEAPGCVIAAINGPTALTISGPTDAVAVARAAIRRHGGRTTDLTVSHAFHSPLMEPIVAQFRGELAGLQPDAADFPVYSTVLGAPVDGHDMDADYWARQICAPVRFLDAVRGALDAVPADYVAEAGPRSTLLTLARKCGLPADIPSMVLCGGPDAPGTELLEAAATLLRDGYSPDLTALSGHPGGQLNRLPPYVFDTSRRYWFDHAVTVVTDTPGPAGEDAAGPADDAQRGADSAVLRLIAEIGGYPLTELTPSSRLAEDLGYDSLLQLRLLDRLRTEFPTLADVTVADVLPKIHSVGDLVDFVVQRLDQRVTSDGRHGGVAPEGS